MNAERSGDQVYIGDFIGTVHDSPSGAFAVAWGMYTNRKSVEDKHFALLQANNVLAQGSVSRRILDGRCSDGGFFALQVIGSTDKSAVLLFGRDGQEYHSRQFSDFLQFYDVSPDGRFMFWATENTVHYTDVSTKKDIFSFSFDHRFCPTSAKLDADGQTVSMRHTDMGWYRFSTAGTFVDEEVWLNDYMQKCNGVTLYNVIRDLHQRQGIRSPEDAETYALWIEEALRRGIEDSFSLKVADVQSYLASFYREAGKTTEAEAADRKAEQNLDGFRLVDRAISQVPEIGEPPNVEFARKLVADLDRATQTQRLHEYPNYMGKLYRTKGEILERIGDAEGAITAYRKALEANPKAGCKRQLEKLTNAPVEIPERPKPKPVEERVDVDRVTMFHFRCPVCGSEPKEKPLIQYLVDWHRADPRRLQMLLIHLVGATWEIRFGNSRWLTKKFQAQADELIRNVSDNKKENAFAPSPFLLSVDAKTITMQTQCPVCETQPGKRTKDNYFTVWAEACKVQSSNLYYEVGLILFGIASAKPSWMSDDLRDYCDMIKSQTFRTGESIGLPSCPQCGRFTTAIFGGTRTDSEKGMCRWCLDASGGIQIRI